MNIGDCEQYIDDVILGRGATYFNDNRVTSLETEDGLSFTAEVAGSELYNVSIELDGDGDILKSYCDCLYDMGEHCKHEAAVYLAIREYRASNAENSAAKPRKSLAEIVRGMSREQLEELLLEAAKRHRQLGDRLRMLYDGRDKTPEQYRSVMEKVAQELWQRENYSRYGGRDGGDPLGEAYLLLDAAETVPQPIEAAWLVFSAIEPLLRNNEVWEMDENGELQEFISNATARVGSILQTHAHELLAREDSAWFEGLLNYSASPIMQENTDTMLELLEGFLPLCAAPPLQALYRRKLDELLENGLYEGIHDYTRSKLRLLCLGSLEAAGQEELAERFIMENLDCDPLRERAILAAEQAGDFSRVLVLARQGLDMRQGKTVLRREWQLHMLTAYRALNDHDGMQKILREFLLGGDFSAFAPYKELVPREQWQDELCKILAQMRAVFYPPPCYSRILEAEGLAGELLEYCKKRPDEVFTYGEALMKALPNETKALATGLIETRAKHSNSRPRHKQLVELLRRYGKLCGKDEMTALAERLAVQYKRKPAMREELGRL